MAVSAAEYLHQLGERVRNARARRGMTRKILARDSSVSERYLAQLESGHGNISIMLLRQVAAALNLPVTELVREGPERGVEHVLLTEKINRLTPQQAAEASVLLSQRFGDGGDGERHNRIALIGLRGAGKSTLGKALAQRLKLPFVELDKEVEADAGMSLNEIFSLWGQAAYRRHERRALDGIIERHAHVVIETGGSLVSEPSTFERLLGACFTIWVQASPEEHMHRVVAQGDHRPMAGNDEAMQDLRRILAQRDALYAKADATLDTSGKSVEASLGELIALVRRATAQAA